METHELKNKADECLEGTYSEHFNVLLDSLILRLNNILLQSILYILFYKTTKFPFTITAFFFFNKHFNTQEIITF